MTKAPGDAGNSGDTANDGRNWLARALYLACICSECEGLPKACVQLALFLKYSMMPDYFVRLALGDQHSLILRQDASVWSTGYNEHGQLGDGSTVDNFEFVCTYLRDAKAVAAGNDHSMALKLDGSVWTSGRNAHGQLGDGSTIDKNAFVQVISSGSQAVYAGRDYSMVLKKDGSVWATGRNNHGQLGDKTTTSRQSFVPVFTGFSSSAKTVAAGAFHCMVLKQDGSVWSTGSNSFGQLGVGLLLGYSTTFRKVVESGGADVASGALHSLVLRQDGSLWAAGRNLFGQLGDGTTVVKSTFTPVITTDVKALTAGHSYSMVLKQDGSVWATGSNVHGQLGDGSTTDRNVFVIVKYGDAKAVAAGFGHSMVLTEDGTVWATGWNLYGQFGDGSITSTSNLIRVAELSDRESHNLVNQRGDWLPSDYLSITTRASTSGKTSSLLVPCASSIPIIDVFVDSVLYSQIEGLENVISGLHAHCPGTGCLRLQYQHVWH